MDSNSINDDLAGKPNVRDAGAASGDGAGADRVHSRDGGSEVAALKARIAELEAALRAEPTQEMLEAFDRGFRQQLGRRKHGLLKKGFKGSAEQAGLIAMLAARTTLEKP